MLSVFRRQNPSQFRCRLTFHAPSCADQRRFFGRNCSCAGAWEALQPLSDKFLSSVRLASSFQDYYLSYFLNILTTRTRVPAYQSDSGVVLLFSEFSFLDFLHWESDKGSQVMSEHTWKIRLYFNQIWVNSNKAIVAEWFFQASSDIFQPSFWAYLTFWKIFEIRLQRDGNYLDGFFIGLYLVTSI